MSVMRLQPCAPRKRSKRPIFWRYQMRTARKRSQSPHQFHHPKEQPVSLKPIKASKQNRNRKKQEVKRLLKDQQHPRPIPLRLEDVVNKRLG